LLGPAFTIAMLRAIEALLSPVVADLVLAVGMDVVLAILLAPERPVWLAKPGSIAKKFSKK
jgi:hypothetical protein